MRTVNNLKSLIFGDQRAVSNGDGTYLVYEAGDTLPPLTLAEVAANAASSALAAEADADRQDARANLAADIDKMKLIRDTNPGSAAERDANAKDLAKVLLRTLKWLRAGV